MDRTAKKHLMAIPVQPYTGDGSTVCAAEGRGNGTVEERHRKEPPAVRPADE